MGSSARGRQCTVEAAERRTARLRVVRVRQSLMYRCVGAAARVAHQRARAHACQHSARMIRSDRRAPVPSACDHRTASVERQERHQQTALWTSHRPCLSEGKHACVLCERAVTAPASQCLLGRRWGRCTSSHRPTCDRSLAPLPDTKGPGVRHWHANVDHDADVQLQEKLRPGCSTW